MFSTCLFMVLILRWVWCYQPESGKMNDWAIREVSWILYNDGASRSRNAPPVNSESWTKAQSPPATCLRAKKLPNPCP